MPVPTTRYGFNKPVVGADADVWGGFLNNGLDDLDALLGAITTGGSSNAYTLTTGLALSALVNGQSFLVRWNHTNTGAATINVDGLGAVALQTPDGAALGEGMATINSYARIAYDGAAFRIVGLVATTDAKLLLTDADVVRTGTANTLTNILTVENAFATVQIHSGPTGFGSRLTCTGASSDFQVFQSTANGFSSVVQVYTLTPSTGVVDWTVAPTIGGVAIATLSGAQTLSNKIINLGSNTLNGSTAQFNLALNDGDFTTLAGSETLTNKTLTSPTINGGTESTRLQLSSETTGTLTIASANKVVACTGGITLDDAVFTADDSILFDPGTSNRTFTRAAGLTMYVNGVDSASATLQANQMGSAYWRTAAVVVLAGAFS